MTRHENSFHKTKTSLLALLNANGLILWKALGLMIVQIVLTFMAMDILSRRPIHLPKKYLWASVLALLSLTAILVMIPMPINIKLLVFTAFSVTFGCMLSFFTHGIDGSALHTAVSGAVSIFIAMMLFGLLLVLMRVNIGWIGVFLFMGLISILIAQIWSKIFQISHAKKILVTIGLVLFSTFVVFDTWDILQNDYGGDFVTASVDFYLNFLYLFIRLLNLK
jgi:FtsH-binding integral membrane protein